MTITLGLNILIYFSKYGEQDSNSFGNGSRLFVGLNFTMLEIKISFLFIDISESNLSNNFPVLPTNGNPSLSSLNPGPSPIIIKQEKALPLPGTAKFLVL